VVAAQVANEIEQQLRLATPRAEVDVGDEDGAVVPDGDLGHFSLSWRLYFAQRLG
jgi:hypothetical protein